MSRLTTLEYNPDNYKNLCNLFEPDPMTCEGCHWYIENSFGCELHQLIFFRDDLGDIVACLDLVP